MDTKKRIRKRKNIKLTNYLTIIIICIISIFAGFFTEKIYSSFSKISSLEKSNIKNEESLKEKQTELSKLKGLLLVLVFAEALRVVPDNLNPEVPLVLKLEHNLLPKRL